MKTLHFAALTIMVFMVATISNAQTTIDFQQGLNSYSGALDTKIRSDAPTSNFGSVADIEIDGSPDYGALLYWDVSSIPAGSIVIAAEITVNAFNPSSHTYEYYESLRSWSEGAATWEIYDTGLAWQIAGASGAADRGSTVLAELSAPSTGFRTSPLNAAGLSVVQGWVDSPSTNLGFVLQDYSDSNTDGIDFYTRETATVANRPMLSVTYLPAGSNIPPTASFEANPPIGPATLSVSFDASASDDLDGTIISYSWTFGDGGIGSGVNPSHDYTSPGFYTVELIVTDNDGASDTTSASINVTQPGAIRFAVLGDFGSAGTPEADVAAEVDSWNPDFIITVGDNNYPDGQAATIDANIGQYYSDYIFPYTGSYGSTATTNRFFPSLGNHDWNGISCTGGSCSGAYFDYFTLPVSPAEERYYDFQWGDVHFFAIDSDTGEPDGTSSTSTQAQWLQAELAASTATWKVVYFHHAAYSSSSNHGSTARMQWPFAAWGADVVMGGHDHTYERLFIDGIVYYVNGLGGRSIYGVATPIAGSQVLYNGDYGAMRVDADATSMTIEFVTRTGSVIDSYTLNKSVATPPVAAFSATPLSGPAPLEVTFSDESTNSPTSWSWDFGDGNVSTEQNPVHSYADAGTYTVSLEATNADGSDTETKVGYIAVAGATSQFFAQAESTASGSVSGGSYSDTFDDDDVFETLTETETNGKPDSRTSLLEHRWTFNLTGGLSTLFYVSAYRNDNPDNDNFEFAYSTDNVNFTTLLSVDSSTETAYQVPLASNPSGTVYVRVKDTNRNRNARSLDNLHVDQMYFEVQNGAAAPVAAFSADPTSGGAPLLVQFTDLSSFAPTSWSWDFGDGNTSTEQNPSHSYAGIGSYDVTLTVTNAYGSDDEVKAGYVNVSDMPVVHVESITVSRQTTGKWIRGTAVVLVHDETGNPVSGVTASGFFSDPNAAVFSAATGGSGTASFESDRTKTPPANWCFEVTNLVLNGTVYDSGANVYTSRCEDGTGSSPAFASSEGVVLGLLDNHPNPFNPSTMITYSLDRSRHVRLEIFDQMGRRVALLDDAVRDAGRHEVRWDGTSQATGMYFYRLISEDYVATGSMLLLR